MKENSKKLNIIAILALLILLFLCELIIQDSPLSWALFPGDSLLLFPLLFFIPLILSVLSLKSKKTIFAIIILSISTLLLITSGLLAFYALALGAAWQN